MNFKRPLLLSPFSDSQRMQAAWREVDIREVWTTIFGFQQVSQCFCFARVPAAPCASLVAFFLTVLSDCRKEEWTLSVFPFLPLFAFEKVRFDALWILQVNALFVPFVFFPFFFVFFSFSLLRSYYRRPWCSSKHFRWLRSREQSQNPALSWNLNGTTKMSLKTQEITGKSSQRGPGGPNPDVLYFFHVWLLSLSMSCTSRLTLVALFGFEDERAFWLHCWSGFRVQFQKWPLLPLISFF